MTFPQARARRTNESRGSRRKKNKGASPKPLAPQCSGPRGEQTSEGWQRALGSRCSALRRPQATGRSVDCRAGLHGSKELFSIPVSAQIAVEATSALAHCTRHDRYFATQRRRKWLYFGRLSPCRTAMAPPVALELRSGGFRVPRSLDILGKPRVNSAESRADLTTFP